MEPDNAFEQAVQQHDQRMAERGLSVWVGSEPTFTDREAQTPAWLNTALGEDKEPRAQALLRSLAEQLPGGLVLRSVGRLYPGERVPRWSLGLLRRRDATPLWQGPPDPLLLATALPPGPVPVAALAEALAEAFRNQAWLSECGESTDAVAGSNWSVRLQAGTQAEPALLFALQAQAFESAAGRVLCATVALPGMGSAGLFLAVLSCLERAALACGLPALVVAGAPPPVDASLELSTVTPDPAVIEINTAPNPDCAGFLRRSRQVWAAATQHRLSPYRLYFNGQVADSGGAGQITFGGATPEQSPFIQNRRLLPALVRYLNRHPALSYLFAHDYVGGGGQSVRPDERGSDAFDDLRLALVLLDRAPDLAPDLLWASLASFLCDAAGNSHRAEINIEKLWNPYLPGRGRLGLVEFRSLRMQFTPERATAIACLLRAVIGMLASGSYRLPLIEWGRVLHDRFALPFYLEADLQAVLEELEAAGLGLGQPIRALLQHNAFRFFGQLELPCGTLELWRGLEFWPLVGDAASAEQSGTSRMVDASTARLEVRWRPAPAAGADEGASDPWPDWQLYVDETRLPLRPESDARGPLGVFGIRYRSFVPRAGLHPMLESQAPLTLVLRHATHPSEYRVQLHEWRTDGQAYAGLPRDLEEARARRTGRMTVVEQARSVPTGAAAAGAGNARLQQGLTAYSLDVRYR